MNERRISRHDDTAETDTARKTIMITTRRRGGFIGVASFGMNSSAFGWTTQRRRLSTFGFVLRSDRTRVIPSCESNTSRLIAVYDHGHGHCFTGADVRRPTPSLLMRSSRRRRRTRTNDAAGNQLLCDAILASSVPADCPTAPAAAAAALLASSAIYLRTRQHKLPDSLADAGPQPAARPADGDC